MALWETEIQAIDPITGKLTKYTGPSIEAFTPKMAHEYCQTHGLGYCRVTGDRVVSEVTTNTKTGKITHIVNYDNDLN